VARLIVKLHGTELTTLNLDPTQEYIAGRAPDAHIRLSEERGISRHHLKFYQREGGWVCEALSKFVPIQLGKQSVEVLELNETTTFSLPPFEFHFEADARPEPIKEEASVEDSGPAENKEPSKNLPTFYQPRVNSNASAASSSSEMSEDTSPKANNEATVAGVQTLIPYFRVSYPNTADDEVLKLEGHIWTGGRESDCEIFVDSPHISRRHFEVSRTKEGFFITDLGSSNGTKVNGVRLPPHEPTEIESGDEITIMNIRMSFEIRDTHFANRLESLPVQAFDPMLAAPVHWSQPQEFMALPAAYAEAEPSQLPTHWKDFRPHHLKYVNWKKNKIRVLLLALLPVLLIGIFQKPKSKQPERAPGSDNSVSFDALAPERKNVVKDSFNLARNLYVQGKYALCLTELAKVHEIIPQFENSKELQSFCDQGLELVPGGNVRRGGEGRPFGVRGKMPSRRAEAASRKRQSQCDPVDLGQGFVHSQGEFFA
jgi:pSer/pThr/pTyr-binding forkhead associated (FHA) protein